MLVLGWGSTYGPIGAACRALRARGVEIAQAHLRHLAPMPKNIGDVLARYERVVIPEMNLGQLAHVIRARFLVDAIALQPGPRPAVHRRRAGDHAGGGRQECLRSRSKLTMKDFKSDQEVRWCPGCGDYAILAAMQSFMPELNIPRERIVFVSGIGCSSRFPYYMNTYGMHSIHGRAPAIATGLSVSRPDLSVWVVTGDGDALSIGGNHLIHALRRNVNLKILLFNNRIYGLTKGQYSPTSELGKITKSTPVGSADSPFNPISLALGAEATFVARTMDSDRKHLQSVLRAAADAPGLGVHRDLPELQHLQRRRVRHVEGAGDPRRLPDPARARAADHVRRREGQFAVIHPPGGFGLRVVPTTSVDPSEIVVHDETVAEPAYAFALSRLPGEDLRQHADRRVPQGRPQLVRHARPRPAGDGAGQARRRPRGGTGRPARRRRHLDDPVGTLLRDRGCRAVRAGRPRSGDQTPILAQGPRSRTSCRRWPGC